MCLFSSLLVCLSLVGPLLLLQVFRKMELAVARRAKSVLDRVRIWPFSLPDYF